jgi:hypothetical protein
MTSLNVQTTKQYQAASSPLPEFSDRETAHWNNHLMWTLANCKPVTLPILHALRSISLFANFLKETK